MTTTTDVFLTQTGGVRTGESYQHDEFTGFAVRSVDVSYNTTSSTLENTYNRSFATAAITDRTEGSNWFMPCFLDVDPINDPALFGQPALGTNVASASLAVGDVVRFGSTYSGGSSPYCTILEKVPITFLVNDQASDAAVVEYLPGLVDQTETGYDTNLVRTPSPTFLTLAATNNVLAADQIKGLKLGTTDTDHAFHANHLVLRDANDRAGRDSALYPTRDKATTNVAGLLNSVSGTVVLVNDSSGTDKLFVTADHKNKPYVGGYMRIELPGGTLVTRVRITQVSGFNSSEAGSAGESYAAVVKFTPSLAHEHSTYNLLSEIGRNTEADAMFENYTCDAACYAYRVNRLVNLTTISNRSAQNWSTTLTQANLHLGGITVPGEYRREADSRDFSAASRVYDTVHETSHYSSSTVRSKYDYRTKFTSIPFLRAQQLDLERCYYPVYRMKDWRQDKLQDEHPLRIKLDYDVKQVSKITLCKYSIFGKRQVAKEDAAQMPDDDYFILRFRELDGRVVSNNPIAHRCFGVIQLGGDLATPDSTGAQEFTQTLSNENAMTLIVQPPKKVQTLTLDVLDRDGNPAHFGRIHVWLKLDVLACA